MNVVVHPRTTTNEGAVRGIGYAALRDWNCEQREDGSDDRTFVCTAQREKMRLETTILPLSFVKPVYINAAEQVDDGGHSRVCATKAIRILLTAEALVQTAGQRWEQSAQSTGASDGMAEEGHWEAPSQAMEIHVVREAASWHNLHASVANL